MTAMNGITNLRRVWRRLDKRLRFLLLVTAAPIATIWIIIGTFVLFLLVESSPLGCPPTMGCPERRTNECSPWMGFLRPARAREACQDDR